MTKQFMKLLMLVWIACCSWAAAAGPPESNGNAGFNVPPMLVVPAKAPIIAAALAGKRIVAVGDYGVVILSDNGKIYRQAKVVPTRAVLTSLFFLDDRRGWAAGHDGTILMTGDAGETWQLLRQEPGKERVLLSIWFENASHGLAVGQFGLVLETDDGGKTWRERRLLDASAPSDKHMMQIFSGAGGLVFIAAESGSLFRSTDSGRNWKAIQTANKGSFWVGKALADGGLLTAGMRGHIYRSNDKGMSWKEVPSGTQQSITGIVEHSDGRLLLVGNSGVMLESRDGGRSFAVQVRADRANITTVVTHDAKELLFSLSGVLDFGEARRDQGN